MAPSSSNHLQKSNRLYQVSVGQCLAVVDTISPKGYVAMAICDGSQSQQWQLEGWCWYPTTSNVPDIDCPPLDGEYCTLLLWQGKRDGTNYMDWTVFLKTWRMNAVCLQNWFQPPWSAQSKYTVVPTAFVWLPLLEISTPLFPENNSLSYVLECVMQVI